MSSKPAVSAPPQMVVSPCISICTLDDAGVCMGCGRTVDEITNWLDLSEQERALVMERLAQSTA